MRSNFLITIGCVMIFLLVFSCDKKTSDKTATVEFELKGAAGDELIRITENDDAAVLVKDEKISTEWKQYRLTVHESFGNLKLYYLNSGPGRIIYIKNGLVKFNRTDLLNRETRFYDLNANRLFTEDSAPMATVRSGIIGWSGYIEMCPSGCPQHMHFSARGETGDELIRVTMDDDAVVLVKDQPVPREWKRFDIPVSESAKNFRIYYLNGVLGRCLYIQDGLVILNEKDVLNRESEFYDLSNARKFSEGRAELATVRSGIMGWSGYLAMEPIKPEFE